LSAGDIEAQVFASIEQLEVPGSAMAEEPSLVGLPDGRVLLSWTELSGPTYAEVRMSLFDGNVWTDPMTVASGDDLFVNYADFPSAVGLEDGSIAIHWLQMNSASYYGYDIKIATSADDGATWGQAVIPHRDGSPLQHGFVSLLPDGPNGLLAMWLDGRNYDTARPKLDGDIDLNAMQLRATSYSTEAGLGEDLVLDTQTCTCCQTSATIAAEGTVILAYRDRTVEEIRDISVIRRVGGQWEQPTLVSGDGWEIAGCPVNGPAVDAHGDSVALVWFTAADDVPAVKIAFSGDRGASFGTARRIDLGDPLGRVDVLQLSDGSALFSWVEMVGSGEVYMVCRASEIEGCGEPERLAISTSGRIIGFPRIETERDYVYLAWTELSRGATGNPDGGTVIRVAKATLELLP